MVKRLANTKKSAGSNPSPRIFQSVGPPQCPYLYRIVLDFKLFSVRLHKWVDSDDQRYPHDHPWWFIVLVLKGMYYDISEDGYCVEKMKAGTIRYRPADHRHMVYVGRDKPVWTLLITGPNIRRWGFWVKGKLIKRDKYFATYGHHCDDNVPIRIKPNGERI